MASSTTTSSMGLVLPVAGPQGTTGPDWGNLLIAALVALDSHDHSSGRGVKIGPSGLNINADLGYNQKNATDLRTVRFYNNTSAVNATSDASCVYVKNGDLYFNNSSGTAIQLTSSGAINVASLGTITGDYSTSSANLSYNNTTKVFTFTQSSGVTAKLAGADISIYEAVSSGNAVTLKVPTGLASSYSLTFGAALPSAAQLISISAAGVLSYTTAATDMITDNAVTDAKVRQSSGLSVLGRSANTTGNIADITAGTDGYVLRRSGTTIGFGTVATAGIADNAITQAKRSLRSTGTTVGAGGLAISASCGSYSTSSTSYVDVTNLSITITTLGNPVHLELKPTSSTSGLYITAAGGSGPGAFGYLKFVRDSTDVSEEGIFGTTGAGICNTGMLGALDTPAAGTYTYKVSVKCTATATSPVFHVDNAKLYVWEMF